MYKQLSSIILMGLLSFSITPSRSSAEFTPSNAAAKNSPNPNRDGIAIKLLLENDGVSVIIALTQLWTIPEFKGVRFYTYHVPLGSKPNRIGYVVTDPIKQYSPPVETVILHDRQYHFTKADMDRKENGALTVERVGRSNDKYHIQGVYSYFSKLFVLDYDLTIDQPILLSYEREVSTP